MCTRKMASGSSITSDRSGLLAHGRGTAATAASASGFQGGEISTGSGIISELRLAGYNGVLAVEHEDPVIGRLEGLRKAARHLVPLLLHDPPEPAWW